MKSSDQAPVIPKNWLDDVTAIIKTFERPRVLDRLIRSIRQHYPALKIIVADDSEIPYPRDDVEYHVLPFDSGAGRGRNFLVDRVQTKYLLTLDDDMIFTSRTRLHRFAEMLENTPFNLVAGDVKPWDCETWHDHGSLNIVGDELVLEKYASVGDWEGIPLYDVVHQFFMAETKIVRSVGWNDELKTEEHDDFFLRGKGNFVITYCADVEIEHFRELDNERYMQFRNRRQFSSLIYEKYGIRSKRVLNGR